MSLAAVTPAVAGPTTTGTFRAPSAGTSWREVLERAARTAERTQFAARMVVIGLDDDGPHVTELHLVRARDGAVRVGRSESWLIGTDGEAAFFQDERAQRLLRLGAVERLGFDAEIADRNYRVGLERSDDLDSGPARVVRFERDGVVRERLYVDRATGLVVRRETYGADGKAERVVALTDLEIRAQTVATPESLEEWRDREAVAVDVILAQRGRWHVPESLPLGFELVSGLLVDHGDALHLHYSDGLYSLSVFQQPGRVDPSSLDGAVGYHTDGTSVYRWPGAEPERMVWTGDGMTFTAVTDAPTTVAMAAVADLPHDPAPGLVDRINRGLKRVALWIWPFD